MKVLVAMSGGVDSSVAAALLRDAGHEVVGATMKLWGGESDSGCCSVSDVEDARRVAAQLGLAHHVFNFTEEFESHVVVPYVEAHVSALTPNPCIECNRHIKFDRFLNRALRLGFDAVATGHHARIAGGLDGPWRLERGTDVAKDQSYVLSMLGQDQLARLLLPVGEMTKEKVRHLAADLGLRTAAKPDSQDVCFITSASGRGGFLGARIPFSPGRLVDAETGAETGRVEALELVTLGQRRGIGPGPAGERRYVTHVDRATGTATVAGPERMLTSRVAVERLAWSDRPLADGGVIEAQTSSHGTPVAAVFENRPNGRSSPIAGGRPGAERSANRNGEVERSANRNGEVERSAAVRFLEPQRKVAPGQTVAFYHADAVLGSGIVTGND